MSTPETAADILDREFLPMRAKILELAADFDRLDRGAGDVNQDPRLKKLTRALQLLSSEDPDRAEQVQLLFSREYEDDWREQFQLSPPR